MQQLKTRKNVIWAVVIAITGWLTWQTYRQEAAVAVVNSVRTEEVRPVNRNRVADAGMTIEQTPDSFHLEPRLKKTQSFFNLFAIPSQRMQKIDDHAEKSLAPVAPALPFKYIGAVTEENKIRVILDDNGEVLAVNVGDDLGVNYKLISINKSVNNTELIFLYLPMNITQTMVVSNVSEH